MQHCKNFNLNVGSTLQ